MRILIVHNRYQYGGGEDEVFAAERCLLTRMGHAVQTVVFDNASIASRNVVQVGVEAVWSRMAAERIRTAIAAHRPDVMHVHNFFPLASPSIYYAARRAGVKIVQTLHNFRLLCLSANFYRDGKICEDCLHKAVPLPGVRHACYRGSVGASATSAAMLAVHRALGTWGREVDLFLAPGEFVRRKFMEGGVSAERICVKPHFLLDDPGATQGGGRYLLYAGHLAEHKGVPLLLDAWRGVAAEGKRLIVMGEGPLAARVREAAAHDESIEYRGQGTSAQVGAAMADATALVFPSLTYETLGMSMVEAMARGTPVVAFDVGGRRELVRPRETGWLLPADARTLTATMDRILRSPAEACALRASARRHFLATFTAQHNAAIFRGIFERLGENSDAHSSRNARDEWASIG